MISNESEVHASSFFIDVSSGAAVQSSKGLERVFEKPVEKMRAKRGNVSRIDGHRGSEWLCIEKRLWLGIVFRFGFFG